MLEPVARPSAGDPYILMLGMAVNQEVAVPRVLILANASLDDWRILQRRNVLLQISAQPLNRRLRHHSRSAVRIESFSVAVERDLESAAFDFRQGIRKVNVGSMQPHRHLRRPEIVAACRWS